MHKKMISVFVVSFLFSLGEPPLIKAQTELGSLEEFSPRQKKVMGQISQDIYLGTEGLISGPPAPEILSEDYLREKLTFFPAGKRIGSRKFIWFFAQQHIYFGGLVAGILFLVFGFELRGILARDPDISKQYEEISQMMLRFVVAICRL